MKKLIIGLVLVSSTTVFAGVTGHYSGVNNSGENCSLDISTVVNEHGVTLAVQEIYPKAEYLNDSMTMALVPLERKINSGAKVIENFGSRTDGIFTQYQEALKLHVKNKKIQSFSVLRIKHKLLRTSGTWKEVYKCNFDKWIVADFY